MIYYGSSTEFKEAIDIYLPYVKTETLASEIKEGVCEGEITKKENINGHETSISLKRIKII